MLKSSLVQLLLCTCPTLEVYCINFTQTSDIFTCSINSTHNDTGTESSKLTHSHTNYMCKLTCLLNK